MFPPKVLLFFDKCKPLPVFLFWTYSCRETGAMRVRRYRFEGNIFRRRGFAAFLRMNRCEKKLENSKSVPCITPLLGLTAANDGKTASFGLFKRVEAPRPGRKQFVMKDDFDTYRRFAATAVHHLRFEISFERAIEIVQNRMYVVVHS